jgi:hypothetical protein
VLRNRGRTVRKNLLISTMIILRLAIRVLFALPLIATIIILAGGSLDWTGLEIDKSFYAPDGQLRLDKSLMILVISIFLYILGAVLARLFEPLNGIEKNKSLHHNK